MRFALSLLLLFCTAEALSQPAVNDPLLQRHNRISKTALTVLSGWSLASLASGIAGQNKSTGEVRHFHRSNVWWGGVNLGLSAFGLWRMKAGGKRQLTDAHVRKRLESTEKIFLFNTGLDLAYVAYGLYTRERGLRHAGDKRNRLRGAGTSILLQGGFLALFDGVVYLAHNRNGNRSSAALNRLTVVATPQGAGLAYRF